MFDFRGCLQEARLNFRVLAKLIAPQAPFLP